MVKVHAHSFMGCYGSEQSNGDEIKKFQGICFIFCKVVAVDPNGSKMAEPAPINNTKETFFEVEGIGHDFVPTVCDRSVHLWAFLILRKCKLVHKMVTEKRYI